jgi:hypothetical protein
VRDLLSAVVLVLMAGCAFALPLSVLAYRSATNRGGQ